MVALLRQHLQRANQCMKATADAHRSDRTFSVGDWVFLKLQPHVQRSVVICSNPKLAFRYFGPFQVQRVGAVSYKLLLPESSSIHQVLHVSQLRSALLPATFALRALPADPSPSPMPEVVLEHRLYQRGGSSRQQVLVRWTGQSDDLATWEDKDELRHHFPQAPAWGQAASQGGRSVTTRPPATSSPGPRRTGRLRRPNPLLASEEWAQ